MNAFLKKELLGQILEEINDPILSGQHSDDIKRITALTDRLVDLREKETSIILELDCLIMDVLERNPAITQKIKDYSKPLSTLKLSVRAYNALTRWGYMAFNKYGLADTERRQLRIIADLFDVPKDGWHSIRDFGKVSAQELMEKMHKAGYTDFWIDFALWK